MEAPPFRVLSPVSGGRSVYEHLPPPARAPEPYKITPLSTNYGGRSHRTSSFTILLEAKPPSPTPDAVSSRPTSGRISPFRGRGFKGPPPRARSRSRPRSPDSRRGSQSNQNSPRRSQIPRPAATRAKEIKVKENGFIRKTSSPKFGRRANNNHSSNNSYTSSIASKNATNRRSVQRTSELSPIQGSPNKHPTNKNGKTSSKANGSIPRAADRNHLVVPPRVQLAGKRFITATNNPTSQRSRQAANSNAKVNDSSSKIPRKQGLGANSDSTLSLSKLESANNTAINNADSNQRSARNDSKSSMENLKMGNKKSTSRDNVQGNGEEQQFGLVDLLKQTSGATGTSSVVNTTTTTAVQPLHIDAASILAEGELVAKLESLEKQQKNLEAEGKSSDGQKNSAAMEEKVSGNGSKGKNGNLAQTMIKHFGNNEDKSSTGNTGVGKPDTPSVTSESRQDVIMEESETQRNAPSSMSSHKKTDSRSSIAHSSNKSTTSTNESKKLSPASRTDSVANKLSDHDDTKKSVNRMKVQEAITAESDSLGSLHSTDTGVSVNTVKGVSSAKEKTGLHVVKRSDEIETLSGNIVHLENNGSRTATGTVPKPSRAGSKARKKAASNRWKRLKFSNKFISGKKQAQPRKKSKWKSWWPKMRCLAIKREPKGQPWPGKQARNQTASTLQLTLDSGDNAAKPTGIKTTPSRWARIKEACRCAKLRARTRFRGRGRVRRGAQAAQVAPAEISSRRMAGCCPGAADRRIGGLCRGLFSSCATSCSNCCTKFWTCSCGCWPKCCKRSAKPKISKPKQSIGSIAQPPVSEENRPKLPDILIEHNSTMKGAIPCLPLPLAWFCLMCNVLLPGVGTTLSGLFNLCCGQPRFSATASPKARFGALVINIIVGISQLFTVLFCLVGWGWSIWWGVTMLRVAKKWKRHKETEAAANDPERAEGGISLPAPGLSQALRAGGA